MNCVKTRRLLSRYIDREIKDGALIAQVKGHLNLCPHCQAELKSLVSAKELMAQKERIAVNEDFLARLKEKLSPQALILELKWLPQAGALARRLIPVPAVATALVFALIFFRLNGVSAVDNYIFTDLNKEEIAILSGYIDSSDLLTKVMLEE